MADYLFKSIPGILYEPFAVCVLLWLALIFPFFRKKNRVFVLLIFASVVCMVVWRMVLSHIVLSSRYAAILIYPAAAASACLCVKISPLGIWIAKKFKKNTPSVKMWLRILPVVIAAGLSITCLCRSLRFKNYASAYKKVAQAYLQYRSGAGELYITNKEINRVSWYAGLKGRAVKEFPDSGEKDACQVIRQMIEKLKNSPGEHFFIFFVKKHEKMPSSAAMHLTEDYGKFEILARYFNSSRKNKEIVLAKYKPVCPDVEELSGKISKISSKNVISNGDFEQVVSGAELEKLKNSCEKLRLAEYSDLNSRLLPRLWTFAFGQWNIVNPPDIRLTEKDALSGKYSLSIDSAPPRKQAILTNWSAFSGKKRFSFLVRTAGAGSTAIEVWVISRDSSKKKTKVTHKADFILPPGKQYRIYGDIPADKFSAEWKDYLLQPRFRGRCVVDDFTLSAY